MNLKAGDLCNKKQENKKLATHQHWVLTCDLLLCIAIMITTIITHVSYIQNKPQIYCKIYSLLWLMSFAVCQSRE